MRNQIWSRYLADFHNYTFVYKEHRETINEAFYDKVCSHLFIVLMYGTSFQNVSSTLINTLCINYLLAGIE